LLEGYWVADLILPSAAFSEEDGTLISGEGRLQQFNKAVQPPGIALPHWQILCMIAQKLGVKGFEFSSVKEIQKEIEKVIPIWKQFSDPDQRVILTNLDHGFNNHVLEKTNHNGSTDYLLSVHYSEDTYQGHPLTFWVKGLRPLVNEKYLLVNPADAKVLDLSDKDETIVKLVGVEQKWPVKIDKNQPIGTMRVILQPGDPLAADIYPAQVRKYHV
jgi:NADH dehydrogenase/NADH:ubiquinone oxidoreductase subunit G